MKAFLEAPESAEALPLQKGISLDSVLNRITFLRLRGGFWFGHGEELLFYPIPDEETLRREHYSWDQSLTVNRTI